MKAMFAKMNRLLRSPVGVALAGMAGILVVVGVVVGQSAPPALPLVALSSEGRDRNQQRNAGGLVCILAG